MASVAFTEDASGYLLLGGIAGQFYASNNEAIMRNCANYDSVTHSGIATWTNSAYIGGIAGYSYGDSPNKIYIQNCLNYGTINHSGTTTGHLHIGGFLGYTYSTNFENCVSGGRISMTKFASGNNHIGNIVGQTQTGSPTITITHCYWTSDVDCDDVYGSGSPITDNETKQVELNTTTVDNLNSYNSSWNKWFMLHLNGGNINSLNQTSLVVTQKHFPDPVKEGNAFLFWCLDTECNEKYDPKATDITKVTELYAAWETVSVRFEGNGGTSSEQTREVAYGQKYGELPKANRTGYTFIGWFTEESEGTEVKTDTTDTLTNNHTLYAYWNANNYTVTFYFGNGTVVNTTLKYNETIVYPYPTREGYEFNGWLPRPDRMPANDTTVIAQWTENATEYVEITIRKKSMTKEEVKEIIKRYTDEEFTIEKFETDKDTGETIVIIVKFNDVEKAKDFVDKIRESSDSVTEVIKVSFSFKGQNSFSIEAGLHTLAKLVLCSSEQKLIKDLICQEDQSQIQLKKQVFMPNLNL